MKYWCIYWNQIHRCCNRFLRGFTSVLQCYTQYFRVYHQFSWDLELHDVPRRFGDWSTMLLRNHDLSQSGNGIWRAVRYPLTCHRCNYLKWSRQIPKIFALNSCYFNYQWGSELKWKWKRHKNILLRALASPLHNLLLVASLLCILEFCWQEENKRHINIVSPKAIPFLLILFFSF